MRVCVCVCVCVCIMYYIYMYYIYIYYICIYMFIYSIYILTLLVSFLWTGATSEKLSNQSSQCQPYLGNICTKYDKEGNTVLVNSIISQSIIDKEIKNIITNASKLVNLEGCEGMYKMLLCAVQLPRCDVHDNRMITLCKHTCKQYKSHICLRNLRERNPVLASQILPRQCKHYTNQNCKDVDHIFCKYCYDF